MKDKKVPLLNILAIAQIIVAEANLFHCINNIYVTFTRQRQNNCLSDEIEFLLFFALYEERKFKNNRVESHT